jgi:hypothetical protein
MPEEPQLYMPDYIIVEQVGLNVTVVLVPTLIEISKVNGT